MTAGSRCLIGTLLVACAVAAPAQAQTDTQPPTAQPAVSAATPASDPKASHWGVVVSLTPSWYVPTSLFNSNGSGATIVGTQFAIGIVRGRWRSGDWGVTFVHEPVKNGSNGHDSDTNCGFTNAPSGGCFNTSGGAVAQNVMMNGVQIHKYIPFKTIKERVQLGIELAAGFGSLKGTLQKTSSDVTNIQTNPKTGQTTGVLTTTVTTEDVTAELPSKVPLGRFTVVAALILNPALKVRWEGGMMMPGETYSTMMATFLFGAQR